MRNAMWVGGGITGMGEIPMLGVREKGIAKVIRDIFRNGEKGFFYDPSDLKAQYQDVAGTTTVNASGQPVGLMLDKSKSLTLGAELNTNKFTTNLTGWVSPVTGSAVIEGDEAKITFTGELGDTSANWFRLIGRYKTGKRFLVTFDATHVSGTGSLQVGTSYVPSLSITPTSNGKVKRSYSAYCSANQDSSAGIVAFASTVSGDVWKISNVSVKEVLGNHAYQTTSAARPILQQKPILGSELVVNGDFSNGTAGWATNNATLNVVGGELGVTSTGGSSTRAQQTITLVAGKHYLFTVKLRRGTSPNSNQARIGTILGQTDILAFSSTSDTYREIEFTANSASAFLTLGYGETAAGQTSYWDNVSIKEILGYRTDQNYIEYDGVDDKLITNLPAPLVNATVLRAIPNVGTEVKYNQTLPMVYEDAANHAGLIAIDRTLTRSEQLRLMTELDKKAGATSFDTTTFKMFDPTQQGFYYDPNDLSTMFQDAAGTVPLTAVGQPVGLILDKSKGLVFGHNIATVTTTTIGNEVAGADYKLKKIADLVVDRWYMFSMTVAEYTGTLDVGVTLATFPLLTYPNLNRTSNGVISFIGKAGSNAFNIYRRATNNAVFTNISVKEIFGNHAYQTTSASRPILRKNAVTGANYLEFDGSDDFLQTSNIDFTATDKVSLIAGVRKLSDVASSVVFELSAAWVHNEGSFILHAPYTTGGPNFYSGARGTATATLTLASRIDGSKYAAPVSAVVSAKHDISGDYSMMVVNGARGSAATTDKGTGNFGNYPLYIGRRAGIAAPFTGHIYGLIGIGKLTSDTETAIIEKELSKRVGVDLNV